MYFMSEAEFAASKSVDNQVVDERNQESSQTNLETACSFLKEEDLAANIQKISPGGFFVVERHNSSVGSVTVGNENRNFYTESSLLRKEPSVKVSRIEAIVASVNDADVLLLGECHDDSEAHCVELDVLQRCHTAWGGSRRLVLSLEMFERDVQPILDEYMCDAIAERDLLADARPWPNYADAYRPLVLFAKRHGIRVIAANAPRRYVSLVGTTGRDALQRIAASGSAWLPPLPYAAASPAYAAKFDAQMRALLAGGDAAAADGEGGRGNGAQEGGGGCPYIGWSAERTRHMLDAQVNASLWPELPIAPATADQSPPTHRAGGPAAGSGVVLRAAPAAPLPSARPTGERERERERERAVAARRGPSLGRRRGPAGRRPAHR